MAQHNTRLKPDKNHYQPYYHPRCCPTSISLSQRPQVYQFPSNFLAMVYWTKKWPTAAAAKDRTENRTQTLPRSHRSMGIITKGITMAPILPPPEQTPKPLVLVLVSKDSVVSGYRIWKTSFMKNRASDPKKTIVDAAKRRCEMAAPKKKIINDLFLPKLGCSMRQKLTIRLGSSPATVKKYLERSSADDLVVRWKASMTSCPQKQKLMMIQQAIKAATLPRYLYCSRTRKEWQSVWSDRPLAALCYQNSYLMSSCQERVRGSLPFACSIFYTTNRPSSMR